MMSIVQFQNFNFINFIIIFRKTNCLTRLLNCFLIFNYFF